MRIYILSAFLCFTAFSAQDPDRKAWDEYQAFTKGQDGPEAVAGYRAKLAADGLSDQQIWERVFLIDKLRQEYRQEAWTSRFNQLYASTQDVFSTEPNAFLASAIKGMKPGTALDVAMGQGRNTLFLARNGWDATGFDPAEEGLKAAQAEAAKAGVKIKTVKARYEEFDFGEERWDLIVFCYAFAPLSDAGLVGRVRKSLKPDGLVLIEHPMNDPASAMHPQDRVNSLTSAFASGFRILFYEDTSGISEWQQSRVKRSEDRRRMVRLLARRFDEKPAALRWESGTAMPAGNPFPLQQPVAIGKRVYVIMDRTNALLEYDAGAGRWKDTGAPLPLKRHHFAVVTVRGKLYTLGGCTGMSENDKHDPVDTIEEYDPASNTWRNMAPLPEPRRNVTAAVLDDRIYVFGGENAAAKSLPLAIFDPAANRWTSTTQAVPVPAFGAAHAVNGKIYLVGAATQEFEPATGEVRAKSPMAVARAGFGSATIGEWIYVAGGMRNKAPSSAVERYNPGRDTWEKLPDLPAGKFAPGVAANSDRLFVLGGVTTTWDKPDTAVHVMRP